MRIHRKPPVVTGLLTACLALVVTASAHGQTPGRQQQQCNAELTPAQVEIGSRAVQLTAKLSENIGPITDFKAPEASGLVLASPTDLPRTDLAAGAAEARPIKMAEGTNSWTLYLNTSNAKAGQHEVTLVARDRECKSRLTVRPAG